MFRFFKKRSERESDLVEASMNFDAENVAPFLERIATLLTDGLDSAGVSEIASWINQIPHDQERSRLLQVTYENESVPLRISAFMDDIDSPDLAFHTSAGLAAAITREFHHFCEELGI